MRRLLEAEEAAEASLADARAEAERIHAEARAEARAIAERAERRVGLMHRIADEAIERETERLEAEGERRRAHVRETRLDDEVLARAAERVAAALSGAEGA
jgi:vacuolar-type H+-ATPase subunit H